MTYESKLMCGIILLTIPTIQFGGYFLLKVLSGKYEHASFTTFQKSMFRAGHAHAGVLVILSLLCELLIDNIISTNLLTWVMRASFPASALLISGGFFAGAAGNNITKPQKGIILLYVGVAVLAIGLIMTGVSLLTS